MRCCSCRAVDHERCGPSSVISSRMRGIKAVKKVHYEEMLFERRNWLANVGCVPYAYNQDGHTDECLDDGGPRMHPQSFSF
jgi:hypothetical protein